MATPSIPADGHGDPTRRDFLMVATGALGAVGVAAVAWPFINNLNPAADTLALSSVEVNVQPIQVGQAVTVKWRGKPLFIRHRTPEEIKAAEAVPLADLRDPQTDNSRVTDLAKKDKLTMRQIAQVVAGARAKLVMVGTPQSLADRMEQWYVEEAADGFNIMPPYLPGSLNEFVELVIPELQRRGLFRTEYTGRTLREHLGLPRPPSRYANRATVAAE